MAFLSTYAYIWKRPRHVNITTIIIIVTITTCERARFLKIYVKRFCRFLNSPRRQMAAREQYNVRTVSRTIWPRQIPIAFEFCTTLNATSGYTLIFCARFFR